MKVLIDATPCKFEATSLGHRVLGFMLTDSGKLARRELEATSLNAIEKAMTDMRDEVGAAYAGSYFVSAIRHPRDSGRALNGFSKMTWKIEVDRDPVAA